MPTVRSTLSLGHNTLTVTGADKKQQNDQISPTMPPPPMTASTINPSFVQNNNQPAKYDSQSYFKGISPSLDVHLADQKKTLRPMPVCMPLIYRPTILVQKRRI